MSEDNLICSLLDKPDLPHLTPHFLGFTIASSPRLLAMFFPLPMNRACCLSGKSSTEVKSDIQGSLL